MQSIKKYKYFLILSLFLFFGIFIKNFDNGFIIKELANNITKLYSVNNIDITGRERSSKDKLSKILSLYENKSLLSLNLLKIQNDIEKIAWIKDVIVRRIFPKTLSIKIEEYKPLAVWERGKEQYILDEYGYAIERISSNEFQNYFKIKGMGADRKLKNLIDNLKNFEDIYSQIEHASLVSNRRWDLYYKNGVRILLPENNISESLNLLDSYIKKNRLIEKGHRKIDLRVDGKITTDRIRSDG